MFELGSFRPDQIIKAYQTGSKHHEASPSTHENSADLSLEQEKRTEKTSVRNSLQILAANTFSRRSRRRRRTQNSYDSFDFASSSSTLFVQSSRPEEHSKLALEQTATQTSPSISETSPTKIGLTFRTRKSTPGPNKHSANIRGISTRRYRERIRQFSGAAARNRKMEKNNKDMENRDDTKHRGLPRNSLSRYRLAGFARGGNRSSIPLPHSSSTTFVSGVTANRHTAQRDSASSGSQTKFPSRRSSIVQRGEHAPVGQTPGAALGSGGEFSKGAANNATNATQGLPVAPLRQLMQPLGPPFPKSQTLGGLSRYSGSTNVNEERESSNQASGKQEKGSTESSFDMCEVEDKETVEILKTTCPPKSEVEKERKWKMTALERIGNRVGMETGPELPAQSPPQGGWLWDEDDARLVKTSQPQQYWLGRFTTLLNSFHHEDSFNEPDSATGMEQTSGLGRPTSLTSTQLEEHRAKRAFVALESFCETPEAKESFREFRTAYCRRFGDQWTKWLVVGREEEETSVLGEMSRVFLKRGERRTPDPGSERKTSAGYGGRFNDILRSMRRSLA